MMDKSSSMAEEFVLEQLMAGETRNTVVTRNASGKIYPEGHATMWRRIDRAFQRLRRRGVIAVDSSCNWRIVSTDGRGQGDGEKV